MSDKGTHGQLLYGYLEALRGEQSMRSWAEEKGLDNAAISRWKKADPDLVSLQQVAVALDQPLGAVLLIAGYGTAEDFNGTVPVPPEPPSVAAAIEYDPTLTVGQRDMLRTMLGAFRGDLSDGHRGKKRIVRTDQ